MAGGRPKGSLTGGNAVKHAKEENLEKYCWAMILKGTKELKKSGAPIQMNHIIKLCQLLATLGEADHVDSFEGVLDQLEKRKN